MIVVSAGFSCWYITRDGKDVYSWRMRTFVNIFGWLARMTRFADLNDQIEACNRIFVSDKRWGGTWERPRRR